MSCAVLLLCFSLGCQNGKASRTFAPDSETFSTAVALDDPKDNQVIAAAAALLPNKIQAGETLTLVVKAKTAPTWHIYPCDARKAKFAPTTLKLELPAGITPLGDWRVPPPQKDLEYGDFIYEGTLVFHRKLRVATSAKPGPITLRCELGYQACDPFVCRPPATISLDATAEVVVSP